MNREGRHLARAAATLFDLRERLRRVLIFLSYELRLAFGVGHLALLGLALLAAFGLSQTSALGVWRWFYDLEVILPPLGAALCVPLLLREQQQRTLALIGTTQVSLSALFVLRAVIMLTFCALLISIVWLGATLAPMPAFGSFTFSSSADAKLWEGLGLGDPNSWWSALFTVGAPTLILAGVGVAFAHLTGDARLGYLALFTYWAISRFNYEMLLDPVQRNFYLFVRQALLAYDSADLDWVTPKLIQMTLGLGLLAIAAVRARHVELFLRRERQA
jgi:hypothetical protein